MPVPAAADRVEDAPPGAGLDAGAPDRAPTPVRTPPEGAHALVVGATGITGAALVEQLVASGWRTTGLSRRPAGWRAPGTWPPT